MADYWKSQARKYCDFCKCWISDNKPSVQFHESGKRHKANVEARIKEIGKKSIADQKAKLKLDNDIRKMEEAALKAYIKDAQRNPDLSSTNIKEIAEKQNVSFIKVEHEKKKTQWHEAKSDDGHTYYWHSVTGESRWEVPAEGFISLKDQTIKTAAQISKNIQKPPKKRIKHKNDEKFKKKMKKEMKKNNFVEPRSQPVGPFPDPNPYGKWEVIENKVREPIDLQLPERTNMPLKLSQPILDEEPKIEFMEKSVSSIADFDKNENSNCSFHFKKRKVNRGNARQRSDD